MGLDSLAEERERARREQQVDHVHVSDSVTREPMKSHYSLYARAYSANGNALRRSNRELTVPEALRSTATERCPSRRPKQR